MRHILPGTTVRSIAPVVCDVLAEFPRHFDRVFPAIGAMESSAMVAAGSVDVTRKHGQCLSPIRTGNDDFSPRLLVQLFKCCAMVR